LSIVSLSSYKTLIAIYESRRRSRNAEIAETIMKTCSVSKHFCPGYNLIFHSSSSSNHVQSNPEHIKSTKTSKNHKKYTNYKKPKKPKKTRKNAKKMAKNGKKQKIHKKW
jgi:hypothetical protein